MRLSVDTGGTFTDLVVEDDDGRLSFYKCSTTREDPVRGVLDVVERAASELGLSRAALLSRTDLFIHATTRAINAILTGTVARTALLVTRGHPDILSFREGGRTDLFNFTRFYPDPYVPRRLTFEVPERIDAAGNVVSSLDEEAVVEICRRLEAAEVEAVAVCFLWSIVNPAHERRVGDLLASLLPGVPYTLSSALNPIIREYRRASSTAIDASLKPVMSQYLTSLERRLRDAAFRGRLLVVTSSGGLAESQTVAAAPIYSIGSGPAMAPVAGRHYAMLDAATDTAIVADTGGTSYDVSVVRRARIPWTRETWIGAKYEGHLTGFASVDVKSIGAGGGSIAWIDDGGLLHVGPQSAGAEPGPACYGRGGADPTVTDAALLLGYIDPDYFLGGAMRLDVDAAAHAIEQRLARRLDVGVDEAAESVLQLATELMVRAIEEITLNQGIDPRDAVLIGGGGAAGLNAVAIARRLGCTQVVIPRVGPVLSAAGALMSDLSSEYMQTFQTASDRFDYDGVNHVLGELSDCCREFLSRAAAFGLESRIELFAEARYPHQIWELDIPLRTEHFGTLDDVEALRLDFHRLHEEVFAISDPDSPIEVISWRARAVCRLRAEAPIPLDPPHMGGTGAGRRGMFFRDAGRLEARVQRFDAMEHEDIVEGPAVIETALTTVVLDPGASAKRTSSESLIVFPNAVSTDALGHGAVPQEAEL